MNRKFFAACLLFAFSGSVVAQQSIVGKYSGDFAKSTNQGDATQPLALDIRSVEGDTVKGIVDRYGKGSCVGEYSVAGTVKGDTLKLRATKKGGDAGDCGLWLTMTIQGNKLVGMMNDRWRAELSK